MGKITLLFQESTIMISSRTLLMTTAQLNCILEYPVWLLERLIALFGREGCSPAPSLVVTYDYLDEKEDYALVTLHRRNPSSRRFQSFCQTYSRPAASSINYFLRSLLLTRFTLFGKSSSSQPLVWADTVVMKGTGYRVYRNPLSSQERIFDLGYADPKTLHLRNGRKGYVDPSNTGLTLIGKGVHARTQVLQEVARITNRRVPSAYTGNGVILARNLPKLSLKPKKPKGKS